MILKGCSFDPTQDGVQIEATNFVQNKFEAVFKNVLNPLSTAEMTPFKIQVYDSYEPEARELTGLITSSFTFTI